jgi:hypothetical protein
MEFDHYNFTGPHIMNYILKPIIENQNFVYGKDIVYIPADHNGYSKERILEFSKSGSVDIFENCTYIHLVGSQLMDWTNGSSNYTDRKNLYN